MSHKFKKISQKEKEKEKYLKIFRMFDKNGNNSFGPQELGKVMRFYGMKTSQLELQDMISQIDTNGNGTVQFKQFLTVFRTKMKDSEAEEELREAFKVFDKDGNGFISAEELRHSMTLLGEKLTNEEVDEMIREVDTDRDGEINYEELIMVMTSTAK